MGIVALWPDPKHAARSQRRQTDGHKCGRTFEKGDSVLEEKMPARDITLKECSEKSQDIENAKNNCRKMIQT